MSYAELHCLTNFSFLRGASHAEELVVTAKALGLQAIVVTDRNTLAGVVRMHEAAERLGLRAVIGARLDLQDGASRLCLARFVALRERHNPLGPPCASRQHG